MKKIEFSTRINTISGIDGQKLLGMRREQASSRGLLRRNLHQKDKILVHCPNGRVDAADGHLRPLPDF